MKAAREAGRGVPALSAAECRSRLGLMRWLWSAMRMMSVEGVMLRSVMILLRCVIAVERVVSRECIREGVGC